MEIRRELETIHNPMTQDEGITDLGPFVFQSGVLDFVKVFFN
jgi:hypothetical protein